jgi:hypothetical protein
MPKLPPSQARVELYLVKNGFSGEIAINSGHKNLHAIRQMRKRDRFYTFSIQAIHQALKGRKLSVGLVKKIVIDASGSNSRRIKRLNKGYFDPQKSSAQLLAYIDELEAAAKSKKRIIFATGHPGAMVGFYSVLADWAESLGAKIVTLDRSIKVDGRYYLDMVGKVFTPSDNCSAWHSHDATYMEALLAKAKADLVVADHGFAGAALNHGIRTLAIYDTDDPALPVAASLGESVLAVPIHDNRYNVDGANLAKFIIGGR